MNPPSDQPLNFSEGQPPNRGSRYRYRDGKPADPNEGVHPEMLETDLSGPSAAGVPNGPNELIAMQLRSEQPEMSEQPWSAKVVQVFALMETLDLNAYEAQQIGVAIVRRLESFHDAVVAEMVQAEQVRANQVAAWAVDADRLMHSRILLENVALEGGGPC